MSPCLFTFSKRAPEFSGSDMWGEEVLAAALKLQGPRPLAESWPPLVKVVKDKEVVQAAESVVIQRGFSDVCCHWPLHIPFVMSLGQPIHLKPSLKFLAMERELILKVTAFPAKYCRISHFLFQLLCSPDNRKLARIVPVMITPRDVLTWCILQVKYNQLDSSKVEAFLQGRGQEVLRDELKKPKLLADMLLDLMRYSITFNHFNP